SPADHQHGHHPADDLDPADLQPDLRHDQWWAEQFLLLADLLHLQRGHRAGAVRLRFGDRCAAVPADPGHHGHPALHHQGAHDMTVATSLLERGRIWAEERRFSWIDGPIWLFGMAIAVLWFMPFVWMVSTSFKYPQDVMSLQIEWLPHRVTLDNYIRVFQYPVVRWGINSII